MTAEAFIQLRINEFVFCMYEKKVFFRLFGKDRHTNGLRGTDKMGRTPQKAASPSTVETCTFSLRTIVQQLRHCSDAHALIAAKQLLQHAQNAKGCHAQLFKANVHKRVVDLLNRDNELCKIMAATVIHAIAKTHRHITLFIEAGAMDPLVAMLQSKNNRCREKATMAIHRFASYSGFEHEIADAGPIPMLVRMIIQKDFDSWNMAITILGDLAAAYGLEKRIGCDEKGIEHLIEVVHMYHQDRDSAKKATVALWNLSTPDELKPFIAHSKLFRVFVKMLLGADHIDDTTDVLGLMVNMTAATDEHRQLVANAGAIEAVVKLLHLPTHTYESDGQVCSILHNLSLCDELQPLIVQAGALAPLVQLLRSENTVCQLRAAKALFHISVGEDMEKHIYEAGAITPLLELLQCGCEKSKDMAAGVLWNVSCFKAGKEAIASVESVFPRLAQHLANDEDPHKIAESCFRTLENLELLQLPPHVHLEQGTIGVLRSLLSRQDFLDPHLYALDYLSSTILKHTELQEAMNMLSALASRQEPIAFTVCASILLSCDCADHYDNPSLIPDPIAPAAFATFQFRTTLTPLLVRALRTSDAALHYTIEQKQTVRMQTAHAIQHVLKVSRESNPNRTKHEPTGTENWQKFIHLRVPTDLVLIVDNERFEVHKFVMDLRTDYFHIRFKFPTEHPCTEMVLKDPDEFQFSAHAFRVLLHFVYTGSVDDQMTPHIAQDVLNQADFLRIPELVVAMERYLSQQITASNALEMYSLAQHKNTRVLERLCIHWMLMNLIPFIAEQERGASSQTGQDEDNGVVKLNRTIVETIVEAFFSEIERVSATAAPAHAPALTENMTSEQLDEAMDAIARELQAGHISLPEFHQRMREVDRIRLQAILAN